MIIEYNSKFDEEIKDLLVQLQDYVVSIDKEKYNIVGEDYREKYFQKTIGEINEKNGKMLLYVEDDKLIGMIVGIINNEETKEYDFKAPKRGRITELVVSKELRSNGIGSKLLHEMEKYLKSVDCVDILLEVFGYNESAIKFYEKNGYHARMMDMSKKI